MNEEYFSLTKKDSFDFVPLLIERKLFTLKWVYIIMYTSCESIERHKAQLVPKGLSQVD
jgi:hypothetical protein